MNYMYYFFKPTTCFYYFSMWFEDGQSYFRGLLSGWKGIYVLSRSAGCVGGG